MENGKILSEILVQVFGFLVVFWVLKRFAWKGLLGGIDARRKSIEEAFARLESEQRKVESLEKEVRSRLERIEQEARAKIQEAAAQGAGLARDIQDRARADAQKMVERAQSEIEQDLAKAKISMRNDLVTISSLIAERILREKIDEKEQGRLVDRFLSEVGKS
ncbi:MAG: F0F1 ATP synthase subunit B [Candidatus Omnitrophica bacterium]|nr:F0F1 ATP synthase subunit B [Candidatus Omnitrophota bacterium]